MPDVLLENVDGDVSDEEIREFLVKYGFPPFDEIERLPGDGSRPGVLLAFRNTSAEALRILQPRIHNLFWKDRTISVQLMTERFT